MLLQNTSSTFDKIKKNTDKKSQHAQPFFLFFMSPEETYLCFILSLLLMCIEWRVSLEVSHPTRTRWERRQNSATQWSNWTTTKFHSTFSFLVKINRLKVNTNQAGRIQSSGYVNSDIKSWYFPLFHCIVHIIQDVDEAIEIFRRCWWWWWFQSFFLTLLEYLILILTT